MPRKKNTCSLKELCSKRFEQLDFKDKRFTALVGRPERSGSWLIWGKSFNGKTSFAVQLMAEFATLDKMSVLYVSLEEGLSNTLQKKVMPYVEKKNIRFMEKASKDDLTRELKKQRSAQVIIVDSLQYLGINQSGYIRLRKEFPHKLWIWISHATDKGNPKGLGEYVKYDASVKIMVDGFVATANSRYGGGESFVIWEEKAKELMSI